MAYTVIKKHINDNANYSDFILGGGAAALATVFTNPFDVVKTRMQLEGELVAKGAHTKKYKNINKALVMIAKSDGIWAMQRGLGPNLWFHFILNSVRLGIYSTAVDLNLTKTASGNESILLGAVYGGIGGGIGSALASPFYMMRTYQQSQSGRNLTLDFQRNETSMIATIKRIYKNYGVKGLYRGLSITIPRGILTSGAQLTAFGYTKDYFHRNKIQRDNPRFVSIVAGMMGAKFTAIMMTPADVIATRIYNDSLDKHGKGVLYKGVFDCITKIFKTEGPLGFYKGFWPNYTRTGPHATLLLVFFDEFKHIRFKYFRKPYLDT